MSINTERVAAIHITPRQPHEYETTSGEVFDARAYSLMKYGDNQHAWQYGKLVAEAVGVEIPGVIEADKLVLTAPGAVYSPKPAMAIARSAMTHINEQRVARGIRPARLLRIYEAEMGDPRYAGSSQAEREEALQTRPREHHIPPTLIQDATVLAVDDCTITGTTEKSQLAILEEHQPAEVVFGYAIQVDKSAAALYPGIEDDLNKSADPSIAMISDLIEAERFTLNSRALNFILSAEPSDLSGFLESCPQSLLHEIYEATLNSTLSFIERHTSAVVLLQRTIGHEKQGVA